MARVDIILATYNGADHLAVQIESIRWQSCADWRLLIHDDGSDDATVASLQRSQAQAVILVSLFNSSAAVIRKARDHGGIDTEVTRTLERLPDLSFGSFTELLEAIRTLYQDRPADAGDPPVAPI